MADEDQPRQEAARAVEPLGGQPEAEPAEPRDPAAQLEELQARLLELQRQKMERQVQTLTAELELEQKGNQDQELDWPEEVTTPSPFF
jgi:hypothetical protein